MGASSLALTLIRHEREWCGIHSIPLTIRAQRDGHYESYACPIPPHAYPMRDGHYAHSFARLKLTKITQPQRLQQTHTHTHTGCFKAQQDTLTLTLTPTLILIGLLRGTV